MNARTIIPAIVAAVLVLGFVMGIAAHNQRVLEDGLPPREIRRDQVDAAVRAVQYGEAFRTAVFPVVGTGSMAPYIPAAPAGTAAKSTVVAYAAIRAGAEYKDITAGALCVYRAPWDPKLFVIHGAATHDADGWIMSGLHNARSEAAWRVTPENFVGIVDRVFTWPQ